MGRQRLLLEILRSHETSRSDGLTLPHRIDNFLWTYQTTPHTTTGIPPCELLMGRSLHTRWGLLKSDVGQGVCWCQSKQKEGKDHSAYLRHFVSGQSVMVTDVVKQQLGPLTYLVEISAGKFWKHHVDRITDYPSKRRSLAPNYSNTVTDDEVEFSSPPVGSSLRKGNDAYSTENQDSSHSLSSTLESDPATADQEKSSPQRYPCRVTTSATIMI